MVVLRFPRLRHSNALLIRLPISDHTNVTIPPLITSNPNWTIWFSNYVHRQNCNWSCHQPVRNGEFQVSQICKITVIAPAQYSKFLYCWHIERNINRLRLSNEIFNPIYFLSFINPSVSLEVGNSKQRWTKYPKQIPKWSKYTPGKFRVNNNNYMRSRLRVSFDQTKRKNLFW